MKWLALLERPRAARMLATRRLLTRARALRGAAAGARAARGSVARSVAQRCAFSSDAGDERVNGELNAFERLLQHSQQFRAQMGELEEQQDGGASHSDSDDSDSDDSDSDDSDSDDSDSDDSDSGEEEDVDEERAGEDELQDEEDDREGGNEVEAVDLEGARARAAVARRFRRPSRARMQRNARISRSVRDHILSVPDEALDYEHELESVDVHRARERKFHQLLRRQQDANRVCRNCGERGHVARNCLLPVICSNCGGVGHGARDCLHPSALAPAKKHHHHLRQEDEGESPVQTRYDRFKESFDAELDEYLTNYKPRSKKKKSPVEASKEQDSAPSN